MFFFFHTHLGILLWNDDAVVYIVFFISATHACISRVNDLLCSFYVRGVKRGDGCDVNTVQMTTGPSDRTCVVAKKLGSGLALTVQ